MVNTEPEEKAPLTWIEQQEALLDQKFKPEIKVRPVAAHNETGYSSWQLNYEVFD